MKRKLTTLCTMLLVGIATAWGQTWTGNAPQQGDFYLYNVGANKFLTSGCWWGTHAAMDDDGMLLTLAGADGVYTISTAAAFGANHYLGDNAYMDNGTAANWTFSEVSAGKYTMKNGDNYLVFVSGAVADNTTTTPPSTDAGYWQIVSREDLINNMKSATPSSPVDASFFMTNPKLRRNWSPSNPFSGTDVSDNGSFNANADGLYSGGCTSVGQWHKTFDNYQSLTGLPNGRYQVTVKGFNRLDGGDNNTAAYMYANNETITLPTMGNIGTENADNATRALVDDTYLTSPVTVTVTDGNLRVGVKCESNCGWVTWREFTVKFLDPELSFAADEMVSPMTTSKWYNYGAIPTDDEYEVSSSAAATITYTQNGTQLASSATGTSVSFTAGETKNISLSAGQLYLKSDAATTLSISYKYNVGSATASHAYVQGGETVTITYADASTNDPTATFAKNISGITFNGTAITNYEGATTDKGFTFIVPTVTAGTDYILSIPADAFGYSEGNTYNAAQDIIFKTPALFDGIYYLQAQDGSYVGRGSSYGTRACVNPWGLPLNLATDAEGITTLQYYDTNLYVYVTDDKTAVYADNSNNNSWTLTASGSGTYNIKSVYADSYLTISGSDLALSETPYSWTAHNGTAHKAQMTANKNCQAATAATAAGLSSITTTSELESAVSGWNFTPVIEPASVTTTTESYNPFYNWQATLTTYSADVAIATSGLYKLTIQGFGRLTGNDEVSALQQENADVSPFYAFFGDVTTPLMSVMDLENNTTNYGNNCVQYGGYYYPNGQDGAKAAFQDNKYENTIWVYISSPGTYSYGIKIDGCASVDNGRWCCYTTNSISLSLYSENYWSVFKAAMTSHAPYSDISAADDATGYTTQYNTYLTYTESTDVATLSAAVDYMKNNYANYQWVNASITHPVDVTEGIINGWECTSNDAWLGSGRTDGTGTYYDGSSRTYFTQNHEDGAARSQAVAIPEVGAYLLRTVVRPVYDASYATITIGDESTTTRGIQTGSANIGNGWAYNDIYFATTSADENKTISIALSNVNSGREADCGEMHLLYIGQNADFVKDGIHKYIGTFATAPSLEVTDEVPVIDIKGATFTSGSSAVTFTNPNGLVFVKEDDQTSAAKNEVVGTTCASLQLEKGHPFVNPTEFTATAAKYTLGTGELADGKFATLMVPFAANVPSGGKAYTLDQGINLIDGNIYATEASSIAANSPVLVTAAGNYSGSNVTVPVVASGATFTSGELVGTYTALTAPERSYVLQNHTSGEGVAFYLVGTTKPTVNPFRAYIKKQASAVRAIHVVFDETDGIENVQHPTSNVQHYYDLQGRRVAKPEKGLYIVNGRKTVVQ